MVEEIINGVDMHHDKMTDNYKIILNCKRKLMKNKKNHKKGQERPILNFF